MALGRPNNANGGAEVAAVQARVGAGTLRGFSVYNNNGSTRYIQIHDSASAPADGAVPLMAWPVAAAATLGIEYLSGRRFNSGIYVCNSTTDTTKTLGSADQLIDVQWEA